MNTTSSKFITLTFLACALSACAGKHKHDQPAPPPADVRADYSQGKEAEEYQGADATNAAKTTEAKPEDAVPYAASNTQVIGEEASNGDPSDSGNMSASDTTTKAMNAAKGKKGSAQSAKPANANSAAAEKVLGWLKNGNTRFVKRKLRKDGQGAADRARLASGQHPHSTVFACSDSRMPPELIFDQKLGEIFVIRTDNLSVDSAVIESLENASIKIGTPLVLVLSNGTCGDPAKVVDQVLAQSTTLAEKAKDGSLKFVSATYDLKSGVVQFE